MDDVRASLADELGQQLWASWPQWIDERVAGWLDGRPDVDLESLRAALWMTVKEHVDAWRSRQAESLLRRHPQWKEQFPTAFSSAEQRELRTAVNRIGQAAVHLLLVQRLLTDDVSRTVDQAIRERLWSDLEPQVSAAAAGFRHSAARRGLEVEDLIQEAAAHFHQVVTRFDPTDRRRAMLATWFDDVATNLFAAAVRPRKSDVFHRGTGGPAPTEADSQAPPSSQHEIREQRRQAELADSVRHIDEILCELIRQGTCRIEQVLAFRLYMMEGLTYQDVACALKSHGFEYGTTQMFNFVKEVREHVVRRFQDNPFT